MAVPSNMITLGSKAPEFVLPDTVSGKELALSDLKKQKGLVIMFICNHCPYVLHVVSELKKIGDEYQAKEIGFAAISSNDVIQYPEDGPEHMKKFAEENAFTFPYLYDDSQEVAKAYRAACTPDIYLYNSELELVYRGQLDASRPKNQIPVTGSDLRAALNNLLEGKFIDEDQKPSLGCNIKWKN
jgi:peroxiredoxin